jgi:uncharacterized protein DUF488
MAGLVPAIHVLLDLPTPRKTWMPATRVGMTRRDDAAMPAPNPTNAAVLTIGHSNLAYEPFLALLRRAGVTAIADVRTTPYSRRFAQFNREALSGRLQADGIAYVHLGDELGGRPTGPDLYRDGVADYEKMATTQAFKHGLQRVIDGAAKYRIALMCAERDPLHCHRFLLVSRALAERGVRVGHILDDGQIAPQEQIEDRLLVITGRNADDLFTPRAEKLALAYRERAHGVAFVKPTS